MLGKSGKTGELADLRTEVHELKRELVEEKAKLAELLAQKRELASLEKDLDAKLLELDTDQAAYAGFRKFLEADSESKEANRDFDAAQESLTIHREAAQEAKCCKLELKMQKKRIAALQAEIDEAERFLQEETALVRLVKDAGVLKKKLETVTKLDKRIGALDKKLESATAVPRKDLEKARALAGDVSSLRSTLSQCVFGIEVQPESSTSFTITADGKTIKGKRAKAHVDADIDFPGAGAVRIKNLTGEKEPLVKQAARAREMLTTLLAKYGVAGVGGLELLNTRRAALETERLRLEDRKGGLVGDDDCEELKATLRELEVELGRTQRTRDKNLAASLTSDVLKAKKVELRSIESERRETERKLSEADGVFNVLGRDEKVVRKLLDKATKRLRLANEALADTAAFACSATEYARKERKLERLHIKVDDLKARKPVLEARISSADSVGQEEVASTQERLSEKETAIERIEREREVLATISENIRDARKRAVVGLSGGMEKRMAAVLSEITDAKYDRASVDGNLDMAVYSPDKAEFIALGNGDEAFSTGARDQVYLSARIALLEAITGGTETPLILDDTFANFDDMGRRRRAFEVLEAIAEDRQVLYFTCHESPDHLNKPTAGCKSRTGRSAK
jgi:chromosome segregation ATPase